MNLVAAEKISIDQAKPDKLFYVVANVLPVREDGRCLILKRDEREKVHPGKWGTIGGKEEHINFDVTKPDRQEGDVLVFEKPLFAVLSKEAMEEAGITIKMIPEPLMVDHKLIVRPDGIPVNLFTFAALYDSGEVKPEEGGFTDFAWVNDQEVDKYECLEGVPQEIKTAIQLFQRKNL
jgi:8-oxo-dGTP pyrophosphatase MutT (NUDIX family)